MKTIEQLEQDVAKHVLEMSRIVFRALGSQEAVEDTAWVYYSGQIPLLDKMPDTMDRTLNDAINDCTAKGGKVYGHVTATGRHVWGCCGGDSPTCRIIYELF